MPAKKKAAKNARAESRLNVAQRREFFRRLKKIIPEPRTELRHRSPFELLVAVVLSAQATDVSVNKATATLFKTASTPAAIKKLGAAKLKKHIQSIGLYNTKAKNILRTCGLLIKRHGGEVPDNRADLQALPGVGRKTANVILNTAFGHATIAVDTHIFRVCNRTGLAPGRTPLAVEQTLLAAVPRRYQQHAHHWLILYGRHTCTARKPKCGQCAVRDLCLFEGKTG